MPQANREGIFLATVGDRAVAPNGPNDLTTFVVQYNLLEELATDGAHDVSAESMSITGYHYLEKKDGSLNDYTVEKLKEVFGWDGRDPFWLEEALPADAVVRLTLEAEAYNGKSVLKVKYIDRRDSAGNGAVTKATPDQKAAIRSKLGAKLRAFAGGTPAVKPLVPNGKPTMPARTPAPVPGCTQEEAWQAFVAGIAMPTGVDATAFQAGIGNEWARILTEMFPGKNDENMTPADWARVKAEAPGKFIPF